MNNSQKNIHYILINIAGVQTLSLYSFSFVPQSFLSSGTFFETIELLDCVFWYAWQKILWEWI